MRYWNNFNPRLREGGDKKHSIRQSIRKLFQSTPPRGRRRGADRAVTNAICISIHASAREATHTSNTYQTRPTISIHASAREATPNGHFAYLFCAGFQSTPPRGRRQNPMETVWISSRHFNPRLREGGDWFGTRFSRQNFYFNPRLREGGDKHHSSYIPH